MRRKETEKGGREGKESCEEPFVFAIEKFRNDNSSYGDQGLLVNVPFQFNQGTVTVPDRESTKTNTGPCPPGSHPSGGRSSRERNLLSCHSTLGAPRLRVPAIKGLGYALRGFKHWEPTGKTHRPLGFQSGCPGILSVASKQ